MKRSRKHFSSDFSNGFYSTRTIIILSISAFILSITNIMIDYKHEQPTTKVQSASERVGNVINETLQMYHIDPSWIKINDGKITARIPVRFHFFQFYESLQNALSKIDANIILCEENDATNRIAFKIQRSENEINELLLIQDNSLSNTAGLAAIIVDDFGYTYNDIAKDFIFFNYPLTISIIPGLKESNYIQQQVVLAEKELLVHLPMEPLKVKYDDWGYTITTTLSNTEIKNRVEHAFDQLKYASGLNNHQGSKATADARVMQQVIQVIKAKDKFFIDSRTSGKSIAYDVAKTLGVLAGRNNIFIDAKDDENFIRNQLKKLESMAVEEGGVIGIAHMREKTLNILSEQMPLLATKGIEFVFVSELIK